MRGPGDHGDSEPGTHDVETDDDVRKLMMIADKRWELPSAARERVHAATLATFEAMPEPAPDNQASGKVSNSGHSWRFALAASCLMALGAALLFLTDKPDESSTPTAAVATVLYSAGHSTLDGHRLASGDEIAINAELGTGTDGRLQVRFSSGVELRVDGNTRLRLTGGAEVQLQGGRIYFDTADGGAVRVLTPIGNVSDIGTQFVVELNPTRLDVIVREGAVQIEHRSHIEVARAQPGSGEQLHFTEQGLVSRAAMSTTDPYWHWIGFANTAYQLDNGTLDDYLHKSAHECGLQLKYSDSGSQQAAKTIRPYGTTSLSGCLGAIDEVLVTNRLHRVSADDAYQLVIDFDKDH
jgi:FecR protein